MGGTFLLKLNIDERPIANKYREGKMKSILKKKLKAPEIVKREALNSSQAATFWGWSYGLRCATWSNRRVSRAVRLALSDVVAESGSFRFV